MADNSLPDKSAPAHTIGRQAALALELAETLATRLCHDLAGGIGTLMGALELAADDAGMIGEALPVAREAAETLGQRLRCMRALWGNGAEAMGMDELRLLAAGLPAGRRVRLELTGLDAGRRFTAPGARLLLNLLMVGIESLAGDGLVELIDSGNGDVIIAIAGPRAAWPPGFAAQLVTPETALEAASTQGARHLQAPLAALIAHACGLRVAMLLGPETGRAPPLIASLGTA